mgnify:CR=1 FL=1
MARPKQTGLSYFPKDVSFYTDRKIRRLLHEFGAKGILIYDYILCVIYQDKGYYVNYDEHFSFDVADILGCGINEDLVNEVINGCIRVNLFDKDLYERCQILTSSGIQKRYSTIKRNAEIKKDFIVFTDETAVITTKTQVFTTKPPVSTDVIPLKEKKSKVNNKEKEREIVKRFLPPSLEEVKKFVLEKNYSVDAESFIAFYQSKNWFVGKNKMKDWRAAVVTWEKRNKEFLTNKQSVIKNVNEIWDSQ